MHYPKHLPQNLLCSIHIAFWAGQKHHIHTAIRMRLLRYSLPPFHFQNTNYNPKRQTEKSINFMLLQRLFTAVLRVTFGSLRQTFPPFLRPTRHGAHKLRGPVPACSWVLFTPSTSCSTRIDEKLTGWINIHKNALRNTVRRTWFCKDLLFDSPSDAPVLKCTPSQSPSMFMKTADQSSLFLLENQYGRRSVRIRWKRHHFLLFPYIFLWYSTCSRNLLCLEDHKITR